MLQDAEIVSDILDHPVYAQSDQGLCCSLPS